MIFLRTKVVAPGMLLIGAALLPAQAWTMDELSDGQLGETTGQSGVTLVLKLPVSVDQIALFDGDGFATQTSPGALVLGKNANGSVIGTAPTLGNGMSLSTNKAIAVVMDATGGGNSNATTGAAPLLNVGIALPTVMNIVTGDLGIAAATGSAGGYKVQTTGSGDVKIMDSSSITVNLAGSPLITLQLGNQTQGSFVKFSSLNISSVVFNTAVSLVSPNGGVGASQLSFTPTLTNLDLSGVTLDVATKANLQALFPASTITSGGLVLLQGTATLSNIGFTLDNITAGTNGNAASSTTPVTGGSTFATAMTNAPLGSVGAVGMAVTGLKIGISGM